MYINIFRVLRTYILISIYECVCFHMCMCEHIQMLWDRPLQYFWKISPSMQETRHWAVCWGYKLCTRQVKDGKRKQWKECRQRKELNMRQGARIKKAEEVGEWICMCAERKKEWIEYRNEWMKAPARMMLGRWRAAPNMRLQIEATKVPSWFYQTGESFGAFRVLTPSRRFLMVG